MPRAGLTTDQVVRRAGDLADRDGLETLSLATLAQDLGVRSPSLYNHVAGLGDLQHRVALVGLADLRDLLRAATAGVSGRDALVAMGQAYRAYAHAHPGRYAAALRAPAPDDPEAGAVGQASVDVLLAVLRGYGLEGESALHATRAVRSALHGFVSLEAAGGFGLPLDPDRSFTELLAGLDAALTAGFGH